MQFSDYVTSVHMSILCSPYFVQHVRDVQCRISKN